MSKTIYGCVDGAVAISNLSAPSNLRAMALLIEALVEGIAAARRCNALTDGGTPAAEAALASLLQQPVRSSLT